MRSSLLLLGALFLIPLASAGGVEEWHQHIRTESNATGALPSQVFAFNRPHDWTNTTGQSVFIVNAHYVLEGNAALARHARLTLLVDGVAACEWELSLAPTSQRSNVAVTLECVTPFLAEGDHSTEITSAVVAPAVLTPVIDAVTSITLRQTESIDMDLTITTALDFWLPLLFWVVVLVYALSSDHMLMAGFSTIGLLAHVLPGLPGDFEQWFVFALLGLILEYFYGKVRGTGERT